MTGAAAFEQLMNKACTSRINKPRRPRRITPRRPTPPAAGGSAPHPADYRGAAAKGRRACDAAPALTSEVLILPDGRVLAHDLTPVFAGMLRGLNPDA